ncbi:MAG TPA: response regulator transcription factor [Arthrobacter sp.]|nr:response regulator transcription factor [Arthrobacter sp.]
MNDTTPAPERERRPGDPIRLLLVDDQPLLRMGFRLILEGEDDLEIAGEASDGEEAVALAAETSPDVVLMDVRMPRMDGIEATRRIAEEVPCAKTIILTTFDLDEYAFAGLQAGASAFLLKDVAPAELVNAVRLVASGDAVVAPRITARLLETYVRRPGAGAPGTGPGVAGANGQPGDGSPAGAPPSSPAPERDPLLQDLTPRELEVLGAISEGLSNAEIAHRFFLSEATVKTHVRRILTKLHLRDRVQAVVYAYETGLVVPSQGLDY